jgi:hypothetical protein
MTMQFLVAKRGCRESYRGGTAIEPAGLERDSGRPPVIDDWEPDPGTSSLVSGLAAIATAAVALFLAVLPVAIALRMLDLPAVWLGAAVGCLGVAAGGVKLIAMARVVGERLSSRQPAVKAVVFAD